MLLFVHMFSVLLVLLDAFVIDDTVPIEAEGEVIDMTVGIHVAVHVARYILELVFYRFHIGGHLHGE